MVKIPHTTIARCFVELTLARTAGGREVWQSRLAQKVDTARDCLVAVRRIHWPF